MMDKRTCFSILAFAMVTLLSCCSPVSSFALPRVTRTDDAIIIDYEGVGYAPFSLGRGYGQIVDPGFIPLPAFNPNGMVQPQPMFYNAWSYFGRQATPQCGKGPAAMPTSRSLIDERLAGGSAAKKGAWPFIVALKGGDGKSFCAGTLISDSKVLLAAQCLEKLSVYDISGVTALIGMSKGDFSDVQSTRRISKVVIHSKYNAANYANDIAIITLDMPVVFSKSIGSACLPAANADPDQYADQNAIILGFNATAGLEQALVSMVSNADCRADTTFGQFVSDTTTCITSAGSDKFTCIKDIGGPVVIAVPPVAPATAVTWTIAGINSYTLDCTKGGLKTRVAAFRAWIDTYII